VHGAYRATYKAIGCSLTSPFPDVWRSRRERLSASGSSPTGHPFQRRRASEPLNGARAKEIPDVQPEERDRLPRGQWWAMRDGSPGNHGTPGDEESVTYTSPKWLERSNPTLTATISYL